MGIHMYIDIYICVYMYTYMYIFKVYTGFTIQDDTSDMYIHIYTHTYHVYLKNGKLLLGWIHNDYD